MSEPWQAGARVWYEPTPGLRFAGVVIGPGTLPNTARVKLSGHYALWKNRDATFEAREMTAISGGSLFKRSGKRQEVDG